MRVELLYFDDCPNYERYLPRLRALIERAEPGAALELHRIDSPEQAARERFLGSPSVRVEGTDVEPGATERADFGLKCRLYRTDEGLGGTPPDEWVLAALGAGRAG